MEAPEPFSFEDLGDALDAMREGLQVIDQQWRYVYLNKAAVVHGRRPREELLGRTMMECYPGIERTDVFALLRQCMNERTSGRMENEFTYPDGTSRTFELRIEPTRAGIVVLSIDVTDSRKVEEQLRQAQKMEAIGRLAGGVAHDFNNVLSVILSYADINLAHLRPDEPLSADMMEIKRAAERAADLTRHLLMFSRQQVVEPRALDLNTVLVGLEKMLRRLLGADITLTFLPSSPLGRVLADPGQIEQVVVNLAVNARDAMPRGGKLWQDPQTIKASVTASVLECPADGGAGGSGAGGGGPHEDCAFVHNPSFEGTPTVGLGELGSALPG